MKAKTLKQLKKDGYIFGGLFGIEYSTTIRILNRLLKPHGLKLIVYTNRNEYGDQSFVKLDYTEDGWDAITNNKHQDWCQVNYDCNCGAEK